MDVTASEIRLDPEGDGVGFEPSGWTLDAAPGAPLMHRQPIAVFVILFE